MSRAHRPDQGVIRRAIARIRREFFVRGRAIKEIVRDLHVSRNTVHKVLRSGATAFEYGHEEDALRRCASTQAKGVTYARELLSYPQFGRRGCQGFYTLGVLHEIEGLIGCKLHERFDLIFGTSTGSIIAGLLAIGKTVDEIHELYKKHVVTIMAKKHSHQKSNALAELADEVFEDRMFTDVLTNVGIVTTEWVVEKPMIFKGSIEQAHGRKGTFVPELFGESYGRTFLQCYTKGPDG